MTCVRLVCVHAKFGEFQKMPTFTPEIETIIQAQLDRGQYLTPEEVVLAGLRLLEDREFIRGDLRSCGGRF
jgi:hypothetical protein